AARIVLATEPTWTRSCGESGALVPRSRTPAAPSTTCSGVTSDQLAPISPSSTSARATVAVSVLDGAACAASERPVPARRTASHAASGQARLTSGQQRADARTMTAAHRERRRNAVHVHECTAVGPLLHALHMGKVDDRRAMDAH